MIEFNAVQKIAISLIPLLFAITAHEAAHGYVASKFGDQTAKLAGRLTLNPMKHIDLIGTIVVPLLLIVMGGFVFGWAKPVPVDSRNLHHPKRDMAIVALAGPAANFLMVLFWAAITKLAIFLLPIEGWFSVPLIYMGQTGMLINIVLGILNCLPLPPLDGAKVLAAILPGRTAWYFYKFEPYGFFVLILLMVTGVLTYTITPLIVICYQVVMSLFGISQFG